MGTNFFLTVNACGHCGRDDRLHVGRRSPGWSFGFRAYPHDPDDGVWSPLGFPVRSRADWRKVFELPGARLTDEYGDSVPDPVGWLDGLEAPSADQLAWERAKMGPYWRGDPQIEWRDAEGFLFEIGEFP